ncbi:MAG TPA: metalloregulator ArsR/SmtB family transcription factor [Burkholderiales bacterium]|nr:metalloregulator ArsR/SmtB family transcription factor [Burkholderiales bacterium]
MRTAAEEATALLRSLADADRLLVLCQLSHGERCMDELEKALSIEELALSQHMNVLKNLELVASRVRSKRIYYSIRDPRVLGVLLSLYRLFCAPRGERRPDSA